MASDFSKDVARMRPGRWLRTARHPGQAIVESRPVATADPYRQVVFPNNIRDVRMAKGHLKLLPFSTRIATIPYIRLSKIERGEVFARGEELARIAAALQVVPTSLLIDVTAPDFDIAHWYAPFADGAVADDPAEARIAMLLAAAVRRARALDPELTAGVANDVFGIAPVILSRIENAQKGLSRWSGDIVAAIGRMLGDRHEVALRSWLEELHAAGELDDYLAEIAGADERIERTRQRIAALRMDLERLMPATLPPAPVAAKQPEREPAARAIPLFGTPDSDGTIALVAAEETCPVSMPVGPRAFGIRIARASLGPGLPAGTVVVVDPDRRPRAGGLALVRDGERHRLVSVIVDRTGALVGHSLYPEREIAIDDIHADSVAAIVAAIFA